MSNKKNMSIKKSNVNKLLEISKYMKKLIKRLRKSSHNRSRLYDGKTAAKWAIDNVNSDEDFQGSDCTNFISNALYFGGIPTDKIWYKHSDAWIRVKELRNWLINKGYAVEHKGKLKSKEGDVIQLYHKYKNIWAHSLIITYINSQGEIFVSAHSRPVENILLSEYYPSALFSDIRFLKIII